MKILIVDDSAFMRTMVKGAIRNNIPDVEFIEASDGDEAVEIYKKECPDCVTMDLTMARMNGIDATRHIKQFDPCCKIIMLSAMGQKQFVIEALNAGAVDFIIKPFMDEKLMEMIYKHTYTS